MRYCDRCGTRLAQDNKASSCSACLRYTTLQAPSVPREFWDTDQMRDALATGHMGTVLYAYRTHPYHGRMLSQELVAGWLNLTQAQLSRIENGKAPDALSKLIHYAKVLGIPDELLWFRMPAQQTRSTPVQSAGRSTPGRELGLRTLDPFATLSADEQAHVAAALADARKYLDGSVVDYVARQLGRYKKDDGQLGPAKVLPLVLGLLGTIQQRIGEVKPTTRRSLLGVGADGAEFVGWLYRDLRDSPAAAYWYDRAMEWAQVANDTAMQGYVLLRKSQMAYDLRDAHRVVMFAEAAQSGPWKLSLKIRAEVTQQAALGLAMVGEPMHKVERTMEQANVELARAGLLT
jgi:transcriptional regulator with XRE-family HTH domain